ncbi:MAG: hypothetical protein ACUVUC_00245 [Thermoguttaceae bacterium]
MRCPGQDRGYWTGDMVFEIPCPACGLAVEVFRDESHGRCRGCGHRFLNPGVDLGCAQWCMLAARCLGMVPDRLAGAGPKEPALASRLIEILKQQSQGAPGRLAAGLSAFRHARWLVCREGGDPQVVLAAALLLEIARPAPGPEPADPDQGPAQARQILQQLGLDQDTCERVGRVLASCWAKTPAKDLDSKIVWDASVLARVACEDPAGWLQDPQRLVGQLNTPAAKEAVQHVLDALPPEKPPAGD